MYMHIYISYIYSPNVIYAYVIVSLITRAFYRRCFYIIPILVDIADTLTTYVRSCRVDYSDRAECRHFSKERYALMHINTYACM